MRPALLFVLAFGSGCHWLPIEPDDPRASVPAGHIRLVVDTVEFSSEHAHLYERALQCRRGESDDGAAVLLGDNGALLFFTSGERRDDFLRKARRAQHTRRVFQIGVEGESSIPILEAAASEAIRRVPLHRDGRTARLVHAAVARTGLDVRVISIGPGVALLQLVPYLGCREREGMRYVRLEEMTCELLIEADRPCVLMPGRRTGESLGHLLFQGRRTRVVQFISLSHAINP